MPAVRLPRLPRGPLLAECQRQGVTINALAASAGMHSNRCYDKDGFNWPVADRLACALGLHPASIWGDDWWQVARAADVAHLRAQDKRGGWAGVERSFREWRLCRDRIELHREEWAA